MIVTPEFGSSAWILEHCSMNADPTMLIVGLVVFCIVAVICYFGWIFTIIEKHKLENFIKENEQLQEYADSLKK